MIRCLEMGPHLVQAETQAALDRPQGDLQHARSLLVGQAAEVDPEA